MWHRRTNINWHRYKLYYSYFLQLFYRLTRQILNSKQKFGIFVLSSGRSRKLILGLNRKKNSPIVLIISPLVVFYDLKENKFNLTLKNNCENCFVVGATFSETPFNVDYTTYTYLRRPQSIHQMDLPTSMASCILYIKIFFVPWNNSLLLICTKKE